MRADGWWGSLDWTYDKTGNRLTETRDGTASTYTYEPGTSRLLTVTGGTGLVLAYDDLGNATRYDDLCLDYDAAGRLVALRRLVDPTGCGADRTGACSSCATTLVQENAYDEQFRRTRRVEYEDVDGNRLVVPACTLFFYDTSSRLLAEHDCSAGASPEPGLNVVAEYVYLDGYHVLAARRDGSWYWYVNDHLPTPRKLVDVAGAVVWDARMEPFGRVDAAGSTVAQPLRFPGQVADAVGSVVYNGHRHAAPALGRFLAADPACCGTPGACCSESCYGYANNAVLRAIDPSGAFLEFIGCPDVLRRQVERAIREEAERYPHPLCAFSRSLRDLLDSAQAIPVRCTVAPLAGVHPWCSSTCGAHDGRCGSSVGGVILSSFGVCKECLPRSLMHELIEKFFVSGPEETVWLHARKWAALMALPSRCFLEGP